MRVAAALGRSPRETVTVAHAAILSLRACERTLLALH